MDELVNWFEDRYDPDELADVLGLTVEDIIRKFHERAEDYQLSCEGEEEDTKQEGF